MSLDDRLRRLERGTSDEVSERLEPVASDSLWRFVGDSPPSFLLASIAISLKRIADHFEKTDERQRALDNEGL